MSARLCAKHCAAVRRETIPTLPGGEGPGDDGVIKDDVEAVKWYRKAADQEIPLSQYALAGCYAKGKGVAKDFVEAVKCYRKAAEQGYDEAQLALGDRMIDGRMMLFQFPVGMILPSIILSALCRFHRKSPACK